MLATDAIGASADEGEAEAKEEPATGDVAAATGAAEPAEGVARDQVAGIPPKPAASRGDDAAAPAPAAGADPAPDMPQAPAPALLRTIVFVLLCLLQAFFTMSRVSQTVAMSTDKPVWEGYTGEEMMEEVCAASRTNAPRGTYKVDKIIWPPGICSPRGRYKVMTSTVNVLESAMLLGHFRGPATLLMIGDVSGTLLEHMLWMGGTLQERLGTTVLMWPYLILALASFWMRPVARTLRGPSLGLVLRAVIAGIILRLLALCGLVEGPTMRGRPSANWSSTTAAEL